MNDPNLGNLLDSDAALELPATWPLKRWVPIARDRVGGIGAVTCLQRSSRTAFFAMTTVYAGGDAEAGAVPALARTSRCLRRAGSDWRPPVAGTGDPLFVCAVANYGALAVASISSLRVARIVDRP